MQKAAPPATWLNCCSKILLFFAISLSWMLYFTYFRWRSAMPGSIPTRRCHTWTAGLPTTRVAWLNTPRTRTTRGIWRPRHRPFTRPRLRPRKTRPRRTSAATLKTRRRATPASASENLCAISRLRWLPDRPRWLPSLGRNTTFYTYLCFSQAFLPLFLPPVPEVGSVASKNLWSKTT